MKTVSATFSGAELDAVINALHEAADVRERDALASQEGRLSCAVARFYRRIADDVEDAREQAAGRG